MFSISRIFEPNVLMFVHDFPGRSSFPNAQIRPVHGRSHVRQAEVKTLHPELLETTVSASWTTNCRVASMLESSMNNSIGVNEGMPEFAPASWIGSIPLHAAELAR